MRSLITRDSIIRAMKIQKDFIARKTMEINLLRETIQKCSDDIELAKFTLCLLPEPPTSEGKHE